ncbi:hypothetical protein RhiirA4_474606 [Rhizophagus irregularis]|uniref:HTH myb-type domain-containing protein n=1 Tax=Rhizophagus irregularis TaxID=588596 RepID=A0A2I1H8R9_9GLOM|nr:hypothetical protein RhiirA4_474606 [Rhizophagus irregularis]
MGIPKPKQTKKTQTNQIKTKLIKKKSTKEVDNEIIKFINENKNERNPYIRASKEINKVFTSKQIRQRWISKLDPLLCHENLCEDEKLYIIEWVEKYRNEHPFNNINWKQLIEDLNNKFDNNVSKIVLSYPQDDNASKSAPIYPQVNNVLKSVPTSPQDNNVSTTVSPSPQDNVLKSVSFILYNNNVQERQVSEMMKIRNLLNY